MAISGTNVASLRVRGCHLPQKASTEQQRRMAMRQVRVLAFAAFLSASALVGRASAEEADVAEQLFRDGHALLKEHRYSEACPKFAESQQHDPASGTLLALAYCQELAGQLASAQASYTAAAELARAEKQDERQRAASQRAQELTSRLSTLTIRLPESLWSVPGLRVTNNGVEVARSTWGRPVANDGGDFDVQVTAPGHTAWSTRVTLGPERDQRVVDVPALAGSTEGASAAPLTAPPVKTPAPEQRYWTTPRTIGWAAIGAGTLSGVAALYFTASAKSAQSDVESLVRAEQAAPPDARAPWDALGHSRDADGRRAAAFAQGFGVASGALLIGGAALVIFGSKSPETPDVSAAIAPGAARVQYTRAF